MMNKDKITDIYWPKRLCKCYNTAVYLISYIYINIRLPCFIEPMSTPSHQQREKDEEEKSSKFEDSYVETGQQKGSTASEDKITVKYNEPQTHSTELDMTLEYNSDKVSQDNVTGSPAGQENSSSYCKFNFFSLILIPEKSETAQKVQQDQC